MSTLTIQQQLEQVAKQHCVQNRYLSIERHPVYAYSYIINNHAFHDKTNQGKYNGEFFQGFVVQLFKRYLASKKPNEALEILLRNDILIRGVLPNMGSVEEKFQKEEDFSIDIPVLHARFKFKRFGVDYGMNVMSTNSNGGIHQTITALLNEWESEKIRDGEVSLAYHGIIRLVYRYNIVIGARLHEKNQVYPNQYNLHATLTGIRKYIPWIDWIEDNKSLSTAIINDWISAHNGVTVGNYEDLPIKIRLLSSNQEQMKVSAWRKGILPKNGFDATTGIITFEENYVSEECDEPFAIKIELSVTAPGFQKNRGFTGNQTKRCYQDQFRMSDAAHKILIGISETFNAY